MYSYRQEFNLRCGLGFDDKRDDENLKGLKNSLSASQLECVVFICV